MAWICESDIRSQTCENNYRVARWSTDGELLTVVYAHVLLAHRPVNVGPWKYGDRLKVESAVALVDERVTASWAHPSSCRVRRFRIVCQGLGDEGVGSLRGVRSASRYVGAEVDLMRPKRDDRGVLG
jgi:hypothetical protein